MVVKQGGTAKTAIEETVRFAQHAEELGFQRFWMSEHHNLEHIASAATSLLIGKTVRYGLCECYCSRNK